MNYRMKIVFSPIISWHRHITGYWEKKLPHLPGANSKQFWNIINGN